MGYCLGDEASALEDQYGYESEVAEHEREHAADQKAKDDSRKNNLYIDAKRADIGATIRCPTCHKLFVKRTRDHAFCSNGRTGGKRNCKDRYWNSHSDRIDRTARFNCR